MQLLRPYQIFDPRTVQGLQFWLNADYISGLGVANPANNTALSAWTNLIGGSLSCAQGTGASQPLYKSNVINGKGAVLFDGVNDAFLVTNSPGANASLIFTVLFPITIYVTFRALTSAATGNIMSTRSTVGTNKVSIGIDGTGILYSQLNNGQGIKSTAFTDTTLPHVLVLESDGVSTINQYVDNVLSAGTTATIATNTLASSVSIGATAATGPVFTASPWNGYIMDYLFYNRLTTAAQRTLLTQYLASLRGIAI
jgi:hypothetical protein